MSRDPGQSRGRNYGSGSGGNGGNQGPKKPPKTPHAEVMRIEDAIKPDLTSGKSNIPSRPGYGTNGTSGVLWTNYIELKTDSQYILKSYSISVETAIEEQKPTGKKLARLIELLLNEIQGQGQEQNVLATDFSQIIVSNKQITDINAEGKMFIIPYYSENEESPRPNAKSYQIKVKPDTDLSISEFQDYLRSPTNEYVYRERMIQSLNIFLNYYAKSSRDHTTIGAGRSFPLRNGPKDLGGGLIAIQGYYSSIRLATSRLLANINVSWGIFHKNEQLNVTMREHTGGLWNDISRIRSLGQFLRGVRIEYCYNKGNETIRRVFRIHDLASPRDGTADNGQQVGTPPRIARYGAGSKDVSFWIQERGTHITVYDFFQTERNKRLSIEFPIVNVGSRQRPTYLPAELCTVIPGQRAKAGANPAQTVNMIKIAVRSPSQEIEDIEKYGAEAVGLSTRTNSMMGQYGISVQDNELITVKSRVLPTPTVTFATGGNITSHKWNLLKRSLRPSSDSRRWKCKVLCWKKFDAKAFARLIGCMESNGVQIENQGSPMVLGSQGNDNSLEANLKEAFRNNARGVDCMIIILPDTTKTTYDLVKRLADTEYGVATVCIVQSTLTKSGNPGTLAGNLALKFNLKFRNNNQSVHRQGLSDIVGLDSTMIVGIDVTHSPMENAPSIAGMVASIDQHLGQWPAILRCQEKKGKEMVDHLKFMLGTRIRLWNSKNRRYPENILIYRDGVSEGQYDLVRKEELPMLQEACKELYPNGRMPKITIIVVGKRHHTRFYKYFKGGAENPPPGTIVDRGVTEALTWDFFLQSHSPFKGTARPAHYIVVHDEIFRAKFGPGAANKLETLTHSLCYLFGRSTGAVSICTPAYYADIACQRGRCYADSQPGKQDFDVHERLKDTMFYI
ncbi:Piwi-domain-containing protein [Annulohypoxylon stygium]|nr:Piwi-domain-containing protein [Annulohypoxylon stygium]